MRRSQCRGAKGHEVEVKANQLHAGNLIRETDKA